MSRFFCSEMEKTLRIHRNLMAGRHPNFSLPDNTAISFATGLADLCQMLSFQAANHASRTNNRRKKEAWNNLKDLLAEMTEDILQNRLTHLFTNNRIDIMQESIKTLERSNAFKRYLGYCWSLCVVMSMTVIFAICVSTAGFWGILGGAVLSFWAGMRSSLLDPVSPVMNLFEKQLSLVANISQQLSADHFFKKNRSGHTSGSAPEPNTLASSDRTMIVPIQPSNDNDFPFAPAPANNTQPGFYEQLHLTPPTPIQNRHGHETEYSSTQDPEDNGNRHGHSFASYPSF